MELTKIQTEELLDSLKNRFENNMNRHIGLAWTDVMSKLEANPQKIHSLYQMEQSGGEPDLICLEKNSNSFAFFDCSTESPSGRRSLCYDLPAWESRKANKPDGNAIEMAKQMGVTMLDEEHYQLLQSFGPFDTKTSSWLLTPNDIRNKGGAIFGDFRFGRVFVYHNGAESYYAARGFRAMLPL